MVEQSTEREEALRRYNVGLAYERKATFGYGGDPREGGNLQERAKMFALAVAWYQAGHTTLGELDLNWVSREFEACFGAVHFRNKIGIEDHVTQAFGERGASLLGYALSNDPTILEIPSRKELAAYLEDVGKREYEQQPDVYQLFTKYK